MRRILILITLQISVYLIAQNNKVGINTTTPQETLDINGTLKVQDTTPNATLSNSDYPKFLVIEENGRVKQLDQSEILELVKKNKTEGWGILRYNNTNEGNLVENEDIEKLTAEWDKSKHYIISASILTDKNKIDKVGSGIYSGIVSYKENKWDLDWTAITGMVGFGTRNPDNGIALIKWIKLNDVENTYISELINSSNTIAP